MPPDGVRIRPIGSRAQSYTFAVEPISAVRTTGIYCRPGCGARPNRENVVKFGTAAAAEAAGFRACLRCRPYRSAPLVPWSAPELVCRAVRMILDGALDTGTETTLGARVGVSARHLRRLFRTHLGVTPDALARSARTHFARRLLDDTDLTILEIAYAAGFGSVRQFNRACREIFHASPSELRSRRHRKDRLVADGGLPVRLAYHGALDWPAICSFLAARAIPGVESVSLNTYRRTVTVRGDPGALELGPGADGELFLVVHLPHWEELIHVVERARRIAGLDLDVDEASRHLARDRIIGRLVRARPGIRVPGTWDPFEIGVRAIIGQQVSARGANTLVSRLVESFGTPVGGLSQLGLSATFPSSTRLAEADLDGAGLPTVRAMAVSAFARAVANDEIRLDGSVSLEELVASMTAIPGIGEWTANYIALRLGERDAFPSTDLGLRRALEPYTRRRAIDLAERWRPWRALAVTHVWLSSAPQADVGARSVA
ncbi:MAG TPA: AlkA N-terminal domain-containing protein [Gaiellaceae bacterium]|nr:AlkA N-terminal domain-containing protein [Gaiellaceae bacterium]